MKIAMIGHKRIPGREGGVEVAVEELSLRMATMGHDVTVYNRAKRGFAKVSEYKGVHIITVPTIDSKNLDAVIYSFLATIHAIFCPYDIVHYHSEGPCAFLWILKLFGKRVVVTVHGLNWQQSKWGKFASRFILYGEKMAAKYADEIIVLSRNTTKYFLEQYGRKTHYIPNGVNEPNIREAKIIKEKWGLDKDSYILFLARIIPDKGLHYLLGAFKTIETNKKLVIAGESSHTDDYVAKIKRMAADDGRVVMTGFVKGEVLEELYSNCFMYVLPSDREGMPLTLLEAMSYGCRCLASDIPEIVEVAGNHAWLFEHGNTNSLGDALMQHLNDAACPRTNCNLRDWGSVANEIQNATYTLQSI
jgi:glycosyltransferase involved in cell wall biosynthesis